MIPVAKLLRWIVCGWLCVMSMTGSASGNEDFQILLPGYLQYLPVTAPPAKQLLPNWPLQQGIMLYNAPNPSKLLLVVDQSWPKTDGHYTLIRFTFYQQPHTGVDRVLSVQLHYRDYRYGDNQDSLVTSKSMTIPADQSQVTHTIYVPYNNRFGGGLNIITSEGGNVLEDLSLNNSQYSYGGSNTNQGVQLQYLLISTNNQKFAQYRVTGISLYTMQSNASDQGVNNYANNNQYHFSTKQGWDGYKSIADLPTNWLGYDAFDRLVIPVDEAESIAKNYPQQWQAIRDYVAAGGNLCLLEHQKKEIDPEQFQKFLQQYFPTGPSLNGVQQSNQIYLPKCEETISAVLNQNMTIEDELPDAYDDRFYPSKEAVDPSNTYNRVIKQVTKQEYLAQDWYQGKIELVAAIYFRQSSALAMQISTNNQLPIASHHVRNVGQPMSGMFLFLITLFVVLIGPVNYFYCKGRQRLNWMLFTIPIGAGLVTLLLIAAMLVRDGFRTRSWDRSLVVLDQAQNRAVVSTHRALFSSLTPAGFKQSENTAVYTDPNRLKGIAIVWDTTADQPQFLQSGWLSARQLNTQFVRQIQTSQRRLVVQKQGAAYSVKNQLGANIQQLFVFDQDQCLGQCQTLADQAQVTLDTTSEAAQSILEGLPEPVRAKIAFPSKNFGELRTGQNRVTIEKVPLDLQQQRPRFYIALIDRWPDLEPGSANQVTEQVTEPSYVIGYW
jgi:hypothetical protein